MRIRLIGAVLLAMVVGMAAAANAGADTAPQSAVVKVLDTGFYPPSVTIQTGGTVIWQNRGSFVHTAQTLGGPPLPFDTGGFGPNQDVSLVFSLPGTYYYTSETDCLNGNSLPGFVCGGYSVVVVPPGTVVTANSTAVPQGPPPTPTPTSSPSSSVTITDAGMSPASITIGAGQKVSWTNTGGLVHTATTLAGAPLPFDSGGLGPGQSAVVTFALPGTYSYTSATDCFNGASTPGFGCGPFTVVVR